ncbi:glycosyl transferase [Pectobacterium carotovorum subsp. carotovorum]|nr:glycosyl transferase [Pectobacterium carotovorum subsp. carotovorum]
MKNIRVVLLAAASSIHTIRWARGLSAKGLEVHIISQHPLLEPLSSDIAVHLFPFKGALGYLSMVFGVRRLLKEIQPDLVNAHYASGYATTAHLVAYRPWLLSVWGSDVYDFPYKSLLHKYWIKANLKAANRVASTSRCMATQIKNLVPSLDTIAITPFGVDTDIFKKNIYTDISSKKFNVTIGTVKTMDHKYGIDILIRAFALVLKNIEINSSSLLNDISLRLVGGGPLIEDLKKLSKKLGVFDKVIFTGAIPHSQVPVELSKLDIFVALSRLDSESFGVAAIEAGAASLPVIVSDAGGLPEVVLDETTGLVVPRDKPEAAAEAILRLINDVELRERLGNSGRGHVEENYSWPSCVENMIQVFEKTISESKVNK